MTRTQGALAAIAMTAVLGACTPERAAPSESGAPAPPSVSLPDLAGSEASVRQQIGERYQALTSLIDARAPSGDLARAYGDVGNLLLAAEYYEAAVPFYLNAEALSPSEMQWPFYLGHAYMARADLSNAAASFERTLRLRADDVAALVWLGNVHLDQGQPEAAERRFTQALAREPRTVAALFGLGRAAMAKRDYAGAVDRFEQVLSTDPRASIAHYPLSLAYRQLGDTARAEEHLRQQGGVEVGPPDPLMVELRNLLNGAVAEENRGMRALNARDFTAAAGHFRKAVELAPDNPSIRHKLGTTLSLLGDTRGAVEQFEETVRRAPNFSQSYYSLGVILAANGRYAEAVERFTTAVRYEPNYIEARLQLADTFGRVNQQDRALAQYRAIIDLDPRVKEARFGYAMALAGLQRYGEARDALREAVRLYPDEPRFAEALARLDAALR